MASRSVEDKEIFSTEVLTCGTLPPVNLTLSSGEMSKSVFSDSAEKLRDAMLTVSENCKTNDSVLRSSVVKTWSSGSVSSLMYSAGGIGSVGITGRLTMSITKS